MTSYINIEDTSRDYIMVAVTNSENVVIRTFKIAFTLVVMKSLFSVCKSSCSSISFSILLIIFFIFSFVLLSFFLNKNINYDSWVPSVIWEDLRVDVIVKMGESKSILYLFLFFLEHSSTNFSCFFDGVEVWCLNVFFRGVALPSGVDKILVVFFRSIG